jgi:hypothetical protein
MYITSCRDLSCLIGDMILVCLLLASMPLVGARLYPVRLPQGGVSDHCAALVAPDLIVVAGGQSAGNAVSSAVVLFNTTAGTVSYLPPLSEARYLIACGLAGTEFAIFGGSISATAPVYTAAIDRYQPRLGQKLPTLRNLSSARQYLGFGTSGVAGPGIARPVVAGGYTSGQYLDLVEDTVGIENITLRRPRDGLVAISYVTAGNHMLTAFAGGGTSSAGAVDDIDLLNATTGKMVLPLGGYTLSEARLMLCAVVTSDGKHVLYIGGRNATGYSTTTIDVVDTATNGIIWVSHLITPRERCSAAAYGSFIYVAGGQTSLGNMLDTVEIIDTRDWSVFNHSLTLSNASTSMAAVSVPGLGAVFIGGYNAVDFLDTVTVFSCGDGVINWPDELCDGSPWCSRGCDACGNNLTACPLPGNTTTDCIDLRFTLEHCNTCTNNCSTIPNVVATDTICFYGVCLYTCPVGRHDCNGRSVDGCEVVDTRFLSDPTMCSGCNVSCANLNWPNVATTICVNGTCEIGSCVPPWLDCDGTSQNGCEADVFSSSSNCGACGLPCSATTLNWTNVESTVCQRGICVIGRCIQGYGDCDLTRLNGCETNIWADTSNCGECLRDCSVTPGYPHVVLYNCTGSVDLCIIFSCEDGWSNENGNSSDGCEYSLTVGQAGATPTSTPIDTSIPWWWWIILLVVLVLLTAAIITAILVRRKQLKDRQARAEAAAADKMAETMSSGEVNK